MCVLALVSVVGVLATGCTKGAEEGGGTTAPSETTTATTGDSPAPTTTGETAPPPEPEVPEGPVLRLNLGEGPSSLDPAAARDVAAGNVLTSILDPLVRLDDEQGVVPALADRWRIEDEGRTIVFHLRSDGVWSNGDPVTASDFEYAWKRAMAPRFAKANAGRFADIVGARAYTTCDPEKRKCAQLADRVGVEALDDVTLEVRLKRQAPWYVQQVAHWAFLPVHEPTITEYKRRWTDPANIVTNGPFALADWVRKASITLDRWDGWRAAGDVQLARIEASMIAEPADGLAAFEGGELDACIEGACLPRADVPRLAETPEFAAFPAPATAYLGIDVGRVPDPGQRRAIAIALNRRAIVVDAVPGAESPATSLTPVGVPGFAEINAAFLTDSARRAKARRLLKKADDPKTTLTLAYPVGTAALADLVQHQLGRVGLDVKLRKRAEEGSPADLELTRLTAPGADAIDALGLFVCGSADNGTGFCDKAYDKLVAKARTTPDDAERYAIYAELEAMLTGSKGEFPAVPVYWDTLDVLRQTSVEGFEPNLYGLVDFTQVVLP